MKGLKDFRRSLNKDRSSGGKPGTAVPATFTGVKSAVSIQPPKMVIKAMRDYRSRAPQELSFQKGDFFHVLSDSVNPDWFEAANPMTNARGLVPAAYFEVLTKNVRGPVAGPSSGMGMGAQNGFFPSGGGGGAGTSAGVSPLLGSGAMPVSTASLIGGGGPGVGRAGGAAMPGKAGGGFYAVVKYDFEAERTDELAAKAGESIIVIAQSNYEWFVAKPIGRLGGPGLIPVAYVEIKDLSTGQPVEDVMELIQSGVIPKVEEWKKATADYKNTAIPLGRLDFGAPPQQPQQGLAAPLQPGAFTAEGPAPAPPPKQPGPDDGSGLGGISGGGILMDANGDLPPGLPPGEPLPTGFIRDATVDSFHFEQGDYWFRIQAAHVAKANPQAPPTAPTAPEGEERDLILYRLYEDFYEFQIALLDHFPAEAGRETDPATGKPSARILPLMPGPLEEVDDVITSERRGDLDKYIQELCALPPYILRSELIRLFFEPRPGDHCQVVYPTGNAPGSGSVDHNLGPDANSTMQAAALLETVQSNGTSKYAEDQPAGASAREELTSRVESLRMDGNGGGADRMSGTGSDGRSSGATGPSGSSYLQPQYSMTRNQSATTVGSRGSGASSTHAGWGAASGSVPTRKDSSPSLGGGASTPNLGGGNANNSNAGFIKIKIFHRATDDLVAIRVPPSVTYQSLLEKVKDRLADDIQVLRYRETLDTGANAMMRLSDDDDLRDWLHANTASANAKLTLYADVK